MNTPSELKYTKDHEWVRIEGNIATIGITDFAQSELGDIVFVDVDSVDDELSAGDVFGSVEAVKTVSDLFLPLSGTVTEFNSELKINRSFKHRSLRKKDGLLSWILATQQTHLNFFLQSNTKNLLDKISKIFSKILPIYWAFLTYMLLKPGVENMEYPFMFEGIDKILHISIFAMLGFCFMAAFPKIKFIFYIQIMLCYGMLTEILQDEMHLGRSLENLDLVADTVGVLIGYFLFFRIKSSSF